MSESVTAPGDAIDEAAKALCTPHQCFGVLHTPMKSRMENNHPGGVYIKKDGKTWWMPCPLWVKFMKESGVEVNSEPEELRRFRSKCDRCGIEFDGGTEGLVQSYLNHHRRQKHHAKQTVEDNAYG